MSIGIEDKWWTDPRRIKLIELLKNENIADGAAIHLWYLAQDYWKDKNGEIPEHVFNHMRYAKELVECGLARIDSGWVYVSGSWDYLVCKNKANKRPKSDNNFN